MVKNMLKIDSLDDVQLLKVWSFQVLLLVKGEQYLLKDNRDNEQLVVYHRIMKGNCGHFDMEWVGNVKPPRWFCEVGSYMFSTRRGVTVKWYNKTQREHIVLMLDMLGIAKTFMHDQVQEQKRRIQEIQDEVHALNERVSKLGGIVRKLERFDILAAETVSI